MKILGKILKWLGLAFISFLLLILIAGFTYRLVLPESPEPVGELIDVGGFKLHIVRSGQKSSKPTLVIEGGGGLPTEFTHWLDEGLKDSMRVIRYDRAGIGHSDECITPRDPETIARELHALLEKAGESPPYIMMGHSIGGPYIRVFAQLYPNEVAALFFLDATHHDHVERYNAPKETDFKYKGFMWTIGAQATLADMGILPLYDKLIGTPYEGQGLPEEINYSFKSFLRNGKIFRAYQEEMRYYYSTLERSKAADDFGHLPIRAFSAVAEHWEELPAEEPKVEKKKYREFADLSTNGKHINIIGNHTSIFTEKDNAAIICKEVLQVLRELKE